MLREPGLRAAARSFFGEHHRFADLGGSSGFSGSGFAYVTGAEKSWCLRRWPSGTTEKRLRFIHRALLHSRENGFAGVPVLARTNSGDTVLELGRHLFDAQEWLDGEPLAGEPAFGEPLPNAPLGVRRGTLESLASAVAFFHRSTRHLTLGHKDEQVSLRTRLNELRNESEARHQAIAAGVEDRTDGEERHVARRWLELLLEALNLAGVILREHDAGADNVSTLCHGDVWASHVLFSGPDFVGFTDFESLHFGSPAFDLAQLALHFDGWPARGDVVAAYERVLPLEAEDLAVLPAAAVADLAFEGYWALEQLYGGDRDLSTPEKVAHETNLRGLLGSLELVVGGLR